MAGRKEKIYDEQIAEPLTEILRICRENDIAIAACISLDWDKSKKCHRNVTDSYVEQCCDPPARLLLVSMALSCDGRVNFSLTASEAKP